MQTWFNSETFGDEFKKILDAVHEEFGPQPPAAAAATEGTAENGEDSRKRKNTATPSPPSVVKKVKVDRSKISPIDEIGAEQKLLEVPMLNAKGTGVSLHVKTGNRVFILNRSENEVCLPRGSVVAGFGRGKFKRVGAKDPADNAKDVPYRLEGPDTEVLGQNWKCTPLFFKTLRVFFGEVALSAHSLLFTICFKAVVVVPIPR